jgi:hypothetical protein
MKKSIVICALILATVCPALAGNIPYERDCTENCPPPPCTENCMMAQEEPTTTTEPSTTIEVYSSLVSVIYALV